MAAVNKSNQEK